MYIRLEITMVKLNNIKMHYL